MTVEDGQNVVGSDRERDEQILEEGVHEPNEAGEPQTKNDCRSEEEANTEFDDNHPAFVFLTRMLDLVGLDAVLRQVDPQPEEGDTVALEILSEEDAPIVIGRRGANLDAMQFMVNRVAAKHSKMSVPIILDCCGYRERRREELEEMAQRLAHKAAKTNKAVSIEAMTPADRRIVHLALEKMEGITSYSVGTGVARKLIVVPE